MLPLSLAQASPSLVQENRPDVGQIILVAMFVAVLVGALATWWVLTRYHPPGEAQRARTRRGV